jgi:predicted transglutaminase-like cysteine proteinase
MRIRGGTRVLARGLWLALGLAAATSNTAGASELASNESPSTFSFESSWPAATGPSTVPTLRPEPFGSTKLAGVPEAVLWRRVTQTVIADRAVLAGCRVDANGCPPAARRLLKLIETADAKEGRARLGEINRAVNLAVAYVSDLLQHGTHDVWSSALATLASGRGDCEDYAILKYVALLELGYTAEDLRLVVVKTRLGNQHAVLAVHTNEHWLVLDNVRFVIADDRDLVTYGAVAVLGSEKTDVSLAPDRTLAGRAPAVAMNEAGDLS